VLAYAIDQTTGALTSVGAVATGALPLAVASDPQGKFVYVTNLGANSISVYSIASATGALTLVNTIAAVSLPEGIAVSR